MHTNANHIIHIYVINMPKRHEKYKNVKDNKTILFSTVLRISVRSIHLLNYKINTINTALNLQRV